METAPPSDSGSTRPVEIGPYRILDTLGEGGMGTVYLAEQSAPVRRFVALKVIKLGMDSRGVLARFDAERQALALMEHSAVARIYDAGTTERGQPWFAMEYVKGISITAYCDQNRVSLPHRIELFRKVCSGVQHAHLKGVMHRDLKPSNVLVTVQDGEPTPKIIDFGLAKAVEHRLVEATLFTERGQIIGTPEYMSPEQAGLGGLGVDTRTDIYSLGVLLYELLTGALPFERSRLLAAGYLEMQRIIREADPPRPSTKVTSLGAGADPVARARCLGRGELRRTLRGELDWVAMRALEKDRTRRYGTAAELSEDLSRYLRGEPVLAGRPSLVRVLIKHVRRHPVGVLVALVLVAVAGAASATLGLIAATAAHAVAARNADLANERAEDNARLAAEKGVLAASEARAKEQALRVNSELAAKIRDFDQMAGVVLYERALASEAELYPPWPHMVAAMERWLSEDAGKLLAMRPGIERTVSDLRARALPLTAEQTEKDRKAHPLFPEFDQLRKRVMAARHAHSIRVGTSPLVVPDLTVEQHTLDVAGLETLAWSRVSPATEERLVWGEETLGLAAAREAAGKAKGAPTEFRIMRTLAWALVANGQDAAALQAGERAWNLAPPDEVARCEEDLDAVRRACAHAAEELAADERQLAEVSAVVSERRTYQFELESQRFLHDTLVDLLVKIDSLAGKEKVAVDRRLLWAKQIRHLSLEHPNARHSWAEARAAIASNPKYVGRTIELREQDITGLVPIGENPVTHLWEFYELRSAWDGEADPRAISIPAHEPDGSIKVTGDLGIVFVLLPGGTFVMGAQKEDPHGPGFDPKAGIDESPVHEVTVAPFFLARHELTQGQWRRLQGANADEQSQYAPGQMIWGERITWADPVEQVDWYMSDSVMRRHGLMLPTEAQWEYGCRGGTTAPWVVELSQLRGFANLADATAKSVSPDWACESWTDGHVVHAAVGSFLANGFGLHDVHGNVWEWCRDEYGEYTTSGKSPDGRGHRVVRGGGFNSPAVGSRSALRQRYAPSMRSGYVGLRPARVLRP